MSDKHLQLDAKFPPAGDQPTAIAALVDGVQSGLARQTLLGVTGSGKSIGYDDPLFIEERRGNERVARVVKAGPYIDAVFESNGFRDSDADTEQWTCADGVYYTEAYDPVTGKTGRHRVGAFIRHAAPSSMYRLTSACGRSITLTGDHNLWVLRRGKLALVRTAEVQAEDHLPVPDAIAASDDPSSIDRLSYVDPSDLSVPVDGSLVRYAPAIAARCAAAVGGEAVLARTRALPPCEPAPDWLGDYVAETSEQRAASQSASLAETCGESLPELLPDFWTQLSDHALRLVLRACFGHRGTVDPSGCVSRTTPSARLASDLAYALKRFAIHATLSESGTTDPGAAGYTVSLRGHDLRRFSAHIGFTRPEHSALVEQALQYATDADADVVPIDPRQLGALREELRLTRSALAAMVGRSRPAIASIESGESTPSRRLLLRLLDALAAAMARRPVTTLRWWNVWNELRNLCGVRWTPVGSVEPIDYPHRHVYDLSVPGPETFLAGQGGLIVHNTYSMASVIERVQRPALILAHNKTLAAQLYGEMREFFPNNAVEYFVSYYDYYQPEAYVPSTDTYIEKDSSINDHIEQMRLSATKAILERRDVVIVATVSAIYGLGDPQSYHGMVLHLVRGTRINQRDLLRRLAELQYTRNPLDLARGTYRVRGDVIDVFPAESEADAVRVELFDDEIESISFFDPLTGEVLRKVPRVTIYPKTHYVTPRETLVAAVDQIRDDLALQLKVLREANKLVEAQRLEQRTRFDMEMIMEVGYCTGIENYSRYLSGRKPGEPPPCLFDYLPRDALLFIDESHATIPQLGGMYKGDRSRKETLVQYGFRLPSALDNRPLSFEEFEQIQPQTIFVSATPGRYEYEHSDNVAEQVVRPTGLVDPEVEVRPAGTQVDDVLSEIGERVAANERVLITTLTKRMAEDLTDYLQEHGVRVRYLHSDIDTVERTEIIRDLRLGEFDVLVGINLLREGLDMPEVSLVAIFDADKEGFLRSGGSLIQTIGRAARNVRGKAILYADTVTGSMQTAIDETNRRRARQLEFNAAHGIEPKTIRKAVQDIMEGARTTPRRDGKKSRRTKEKERAYAQMTPEQMLAQIAQLEKRMYQHARDLEFEQAAKLRDEIRDLQEKGLGFGRRAESA